MYVKDMKTGTITRLSQVPGHPEPNGASNTCSISGDGQIVAFQSAAANLVTGDTNGCDDIFVRDMATWTITRVSTSAAGIQANGYSEDPVISTNGRYVAFVSNATNLVPGIAGGMWEVYVKDLQTGAIELARQTPAGTKATALR